MSYDFRRGAEEIQKSVDARDSGTGPRRPFVQNFFWKDGDERYLLFLNPIGDIPKVLLQEVWTSDGRKAHAIARTDPAIGEKKDSIQDTWQYKPVERNLAVAVELEVQMREVRGRDRPVGFTVATRKYQRRIYDEKGEPTEETEEVTTPVVGLVIQAPSNFFRHIAHKDVKVGPITEIPVGITRLGGGTDTEYSVETFENLDVDLSNLVEFIDGISYLSEEEVTSIYESDDDTEIALALGSKLLDKRLNEMADPDYYKEVLDSIDEPARFAKENKPKSTASRQAQQGRNRKPRPSQRKNTESVSSGVDNADAVENSQPNDTDSASQPRKRQRTNRSSPVADRLKELRAESEAAAV